MSTASKLDNKGKEGTTFMQRSEISVQTHNKANYWQAWAENTLLEQSVRSTFGPKGKMSFCSSNEVLSPEFSKATQCIHTGQTKETVAPGTSISWNYTHERVTSCDKRKRDCKEDATLSWFNPWSLCFTCGFIFGAVNKHDRSWQSLKILNFSFLFGQDCFKPKLSATLLPSRVP